MGGATIIGVGDTAFGTEVQNRRRVVVDVVLLLMENGRILLRERANTGYGDGAYEPPTGQLDDRETIVETAIRVASTEVGITISAGNVSLAHVMHDVSGGRAHRLLPDRVRLAGRVHLTRRALVRSREPAHQHA